MSSVKRINHIAILVEDIESALSFWRDGLGLTVSDMGDVPQQQSIVAFLPAGDSMIELIRPIGTESGIARFLRKRGPGMHHVCLEVEDLDSLLSRLGDMGIRMITPEAITGPDGTRVAFIHPESTHSVLVELYEFP